MSSELIPTIEHFSVAHGQRVETPHNQRAVRQPQDREGKGNLFVLVQAQGNINKLPELENRLMNEIANAYYTTQGGVTAGLRRALQNGNQWLYHLNQTRDKDIIAGVVAVVIMEQDLFVAQIGPTTAFTRLNDFVRHLPDHNHLQETTSPGASGPSRIALGMRPTAEAYIQHLQVQAGDLIILADQHLSRALSTEYVRDLKGNTQVISQGLSRLIKEEIASAMIIQIQSADAPPETVQSSFVDKLPGVNDLKSRAQNMNFSMSAIFPSQGEGGNAQPDNSGVSTARFAGYTPQPQTSPDVEDYEEGPSVLSVITANIVNAVTGFLGLIAGGLKSVMGLILPGQQQDEEAYYQADTPAETKRSLMPSRKTMGFLAVAIVVIVLGLTFATYWFKGYTLEKEYQATFELAQTKYQQAQTVAPEQARALLLEAEESLNAAGQLKPEQEEITGLFTAIEELRDSVNGVVRFYYLPALKNYTDAGSKAADLLVEGSNVYVIDQGLHRTYHHTFDQFGESLLADQGTGIIAQQGAEADGTTIGSMRDMVWMPAGGGRQTSDLLILDNNGMLEFDPDWGLARLNLYGIDLWQNPVAAGSYFGNFYVLDEAGDNIYRYLPSANGYENPPENYFTAETNVDMAGAIDMAIDGAIYVLFQDGRVQRYLSGQPTPFQITGLDVPLKDPVAIFTMPDELVTSIYIADRGNRRIVQLTKEGEFVRQLKPRASDGIIFDDLRAVFVDEIGGKMFVLNGNTLYAPPLPDTTN